MPTIPPVQIPGGKVYEILNVGDVAQSAVCGESNVVGLPGVSGLNNTGGTGVAGNSGDSGEGVYGRGKNGVHGESKSPTDSGVWGDNKGGGYGVSGSTKTSFQPAPNGNAGVWGANSGDGIGVKGTSNGGYGVVGYSYSAGVPGVWGGGAVAGEFRGAVNIYGDTSISGNLTMVSPWDVILADCAEHFSVTDAGIKAGTVMVIDHDGNLRPSHCAYDKKVAGVVSGAGDFRPGIILGKQTQNRSALIALFGKVYCKVDASYASVEVGDLLTTSATLGHAMKAGNPYKAFGAVIGKALQPLESGCGLIQVLIALQ